MKETNNKLNRRDALKCSAVAGAAVITAGGCGMASSYKNPGNSALYQKDGAFDPVATKEAYFEMMRSFGYRITDILKTDEFWTCDFLQRDCEKLGMGGILWTNASGIYGQSGAKAYKGEFKDQKFGYMGHDIYLLPGQMLPEHSHSGGPEGYGPKMEAWQVRHGSVEFFGEHNNDGETPISDMPKSEQPWGYGEKWFKSKYVTKRTEQSGKLYTMADPESWHFQRAGSNGAIVTEYATFHNHVMFSKPGMEFKTSEKA